MQSNRTHSAAIAAILSFAAALFTTVLAAEESSLLTTLQQGGNIIYFRHAKTDWSQTDQDRNDLSDCTTQRNLSDAGREQSQLIGTGFKDHAIPVAQVLSSAYCRCKEMAQIAFARFEVSEGITSVYQRPESLRKRRTDALRRMLATPPATGKNTVLIAHQSNLRAAMEVALAEGEAAIYRPDGTGGTELIGRLVPEQWATLGD